MRLQARRVEAIETTGFLDGLLELIVMVVVVVSGGLGCGFVN